MTESRLFAGRYKLQRGIAHVTNGGGVYAAQHEYTRQACAIKLLNPDVPPIVRKRAGREMEALARVQGPGIVEFRDAGVIAEQIYIVMELLEGRTLSGLLAAKGRLEISDAITIVTRIAEILARCHGLGVVHRDVKPLNVYVSAVGHVHVLDFGIAKVAAPEVGPEKLTRENALLGTPEYMAPEALLASPDADHRADQYSLGVVMYECLTGVVPYEGPFAQVTKQMLKKAMVPVTSLRPEIPPELAKWVARALARMPEDRFPNMREMYKALHALHPDATFSMAGTVRPERLTATLADSPLSKRPETRRRHPRASYTALTRIKRGDETTLDGRIEEISESGCQFVAGQSPASGEIVTLRFALPITGNMIDLTATCRWSRATRVAMASGFEFTNAPAEVISEIRKYVMLMGGVL